MTPVTTRRPDALDLAEEIDEFARELKVASALLYSQHRRGVAIPAGAPIIEYTRDVVQRLLAALDAYEART